MSYEDWCRFVAGDHDEEGRTWCRTCEQYVAVTFPRQFHEDEGLRFGCPRDAEDVA